ncbi:Tuberous sclerosis 2-like protein [Sticta canariensis]|nr:Tuberous sclerosis 2-like protein [Sticta canariensis]
MASTQKLIMDPGHGSAQAPVSSGDLDKKIYGQIQGEKFGQVLAGPMSGRVTSDVPDDNVSAPTLTARFKEFTIGRKSLPSLRGATSRGAGSTANPDPTSSSTPGKHVDPETAFRERFLLQLDPSQPLKERIHSLKAASKEVELYSVDTLMAIWAVAEDFAEATASTDVRLVGYDLLLVSVCHSGLDLDERLKFFDMISIPLPTVHANLQILALERLTQKGQQLSPFESQLPFFLDNLLDHVFEAAVQARYRHKRQRSLRSHDPIGEEVSLMNLLTLVDSIVKRNPDTYRDEDLAILVDRMHSIFIRTTATDDINRALAIFERLITFPSFPLNRVARCVDVLCVLISAPTFVSECPTRCLHVMLTGRLRHVTLDTLLGFLHTREEGKPDVRIGAFSTLDHVLVMNGANNFPVIPLQSLLLAFKSVWRSSRASTLDCLRIVGRLLHDDQINYRLLGEDWTIIETTLDEFAKLANETDSADETVIEFRSLVTSSSPLDRYFSYPWSRLLTDDPEIQNRLRCLPSAFEGLWDGLNEEQKWSVINICFILEPFVDDDLWEPVVQFMADEDLLCPPNENWARHLEVLVYLVVLKPSRTESARCRVLQEIKDVRASVHDDQESVSFFDHIALQILDFLAAEPKTQMLSVLAEFITDYALYANMEVFNNVLETFSQSIGVKMIPEFSVWTTLPSEAISIFTTCLVQLFRQCLPLSALKTSKIYEILVSIAASSTIPNKARLIAIKLLSRLRCNPNRAVKVVPVPDSQGLAATLCRTEASAQTQPTSHQTNRVSFNEESQIVRTGRSSAIGSSRSDRSRSATRSASGRERLPRPTPPLWMYGSSKGLTDDLPAETGSVVYVSTDKLVSGCTLNISGWMDTINDILLKGDDWEIYSYLLVHLPSQLSNTMMFDGDAPHIQTLHTLIISQLQTGRVYSPPTTTGMKQGDVALCLLQTLTILVSYRERFTKKQLDETVRAFLTSMEKWDGARKCCIHALALCSHELPYHIDKFLDGVVQKMSQIITQSHLAIDILEFLGGLVRLPDAYRSAKPMLFRTIFGICKEYLKNSRAERQKQKGMSSSRTSYVPTRYSNTIVEIANSAEPNNMNDGQNDLPEYVFALAYHVITFWFLAIDIQERSSHVGWISKNLGYQDDQGNEIMEEQSQVTLDMMHRTAYSDLGETMTSPNFQDQGNKILKKTWLVGMSIVTVEIFKDSGFTQITKRQASGTTHIIFHQQTAPLPSHHVQPRGSVSSYSSVGGIDILPNHVLLQLSSTITPMPIPLQPIILPDDDSTRRAISVFDRNDTVDGHKAGVIYISEAQSSESEILANTTGSALYEDFLTGLGTKVSLQNAKFNTQGLDREVNSDGTHTYAWRDRVTEIVFHVTTMMPTDLKHDPQCVNKKRHIGNDFVNIIFNDSGLPFDMETFKSQFNYVNIIITPDSMAVTRRLNTKSDGPLGQSSIRRGKTKEKQTDIQPCFKVQTVCFPSFPQISPAATPKVVSASTLPGFVRQLALNASVFSLVWSNREGGEHVSSWRNRLRAIAKLRERFANTGVSANVSYPDMGTAEDRGGARSYLEGDDWKGTLMMGGLAEEKQMHLSLDFTRWT